MLPIANNKLQSITHKLQIIAYTLQITNQLMSKLLNKIKHIKKENK